MAKMLQKLSRIVSFYYIKKKYSFTNSVFQCNTLLVHEILAKKYQCTNCGTNRPEKQLNGNTVVTIDPSENLNIICEWTVYLEAYRRLNLPSSLVSYLNPRNWAYL